MRRVQTEIPTYLDLSVRDFLQERGAKKMREICTDLDLAVGVVRSCLQRLRVNGKVSRRKEWDGWVWYAR